MDLKIALKKEIAYVAMTYCGADLEANTKAYQECATTFAMQFKSMAIVEIRYAFQIAAGGKLKDVNITSYYGKFPVSMFADVCRKYISFRDEAIREFEKEKERSEWEKLEAIREEKAAAARMSIVNDWQERKMDNRPFQKWQDVPFNYGEVLREEGIIQNDNDLWRKVKKEVVYAFVNDVRRGQPWITVGDIYSCRKVKDRFEQNPEVFPRELEPRAKTEYFKRLAYNSLLI